MKHLRLLPLLFLCSCGLYSPISGSHTSIYDPKTGKLVFSTNSDSLLMRVTIAGVGSLAASGMTHSGVVKARGDAYSQWVTAAGNATGQAGAAFAKGAIKP